jgi:hypothetical protein
MIASKKTNSNSIGLRIGVVAATVVSIFAPAFSALCQDTLNITETSDTSLTVIWNGTSITPTLVADNDWNFTLPIEIHLGIGDLSPGVVVPVPGAGVLGPYNNIFTSDSYTPPTYTDLVNVTSESPTTDAYALLFTDDVEGLAGSDLEGTNVDLTFHDIANPNQPPPGGGPNVPDNAQTSLLVLASCILLFGAARSSAIKAS